jgi:hypothetical protein
MDKIIAELLHRIESNAELIGNIKGQNGGRRLPYQDYMAVDGLRKANHQHRTELLAQVSGAAPAVEVPAPDNDSFKPVYWFSVLTKCARLLNLPPDEPIPSGVMRAVERLAAPEASTLPDAEFLSKRLARVAKLAGVTMPSGTHKQIAEVAGTVLGDIARRLERASTGTAPAVEAPASEQQARADRVVEWSAAKATTASAGEGSQVHPDSALPSLTPSGHAARAGLDPAAAVEACPVGTAKG